MKKFLILAIIAISLASCSKNSEDITPKVSMKPQFANFKIGVVEQSSVSHYIIEASTDGHEFNGVMTILANTEGESVYKIKVNLTNLFTSPESIVYTRIRSVDIDGKTDVSKVTTLRPKM